ncbi:MAG: DUF3040 domain-containing protein [Propionibacteriales bacterium]|jgi:hypothetical protein|nr:DUF3040 domain-containing protein [Propionibacteriales bacterium]
MALSEEEQKLLEQMEAALAAEDPRLANALRGHQRGWYQRTVIIAAIVFAVGVAVLVIGMDVHPLVSVAGFVVMLAATAVAITAWQQPGDHDGAGVRDPGLAPGAAPRRDDRRRRDDDLN